MRQPLSSPRQRTSTKLTALLFLFAVAWTTLASAAPAARDGDDPGRPAMRFFVDKDGLPQNSVQDIAFDAQGYLWAATQAGAARYNGHEWTVVNMPRRNVSNYVRTILSASDRSMWFGTDGGVARLEDGAWTTFDATSGLPNNRVTDLLESKSASDSSSIWVATQNGGVARFENDAWTAFDARSGLPDNRVLCLYETTASRGERVLLAGTGAGLARFENGNWSRVATPASVGTVVTCLLETTDERGERALWVGTDQGLARLARESWTVWTKATGELPGDQIQCILETKGPGGAPTIWVGTESSGLLELDPRSSRVARVQGFSPDIASLADTRVNGVSNTLWVGMNSRGLVRMRLGRWTAYDTSTGLPSNTVRSFAETVLPDGTSAIWIGTHSGGLARLERGRWTIYDTGTGMSDNLALALLAAPDEDGNPAVWVGTQRGGLDRFVYRGGRWTVETVPTALPGNSFRSILQTEADDGSRVLWLASGGKGIARLEHARWTIFDETSGLPSDDVRVLLETKNRDGGRTLWAGTAGGGLARFDGSTWTGYDASTGLANNSVRSLLEVVGGDGKRTLWVGTYGGISRLDLDAPQPRWSTLSDASRPALPDNTVYQLRQDARGRIYAFTNKGVSRLTPRAPTPDDPSEYSIYTFTTEDGLPSNECNAGASLVDSRGRIWAGTVAGAAVFDPLEEIDAAAPAPLYVERVRVGDAERPTLDGVSLGYDENNLEFEFALLSFFRESETRYRTELVGFDGGPTEWSAEHRRTVTNLPAGDYEFRVWARDAAGTLSGPVVMRFGVTQAPWRTWWAYLLYLGALGGAVYLAVRFRVSTLRRRGEELEATVEARTTELAEKARELSETVGRLEVSEKQALEAKEEAIEASRAKSVFLSNMSHELRTPLNAVIGFAQLMARDQKLVPEQRQNLAVIHRSGEHLLELINDVLSISKIEAGRLALSPKPFDLRRLLQSVHSMIWIKAEEKGIELDFDVDPSFPTTVLGDDGKVRQVLINVLGNAVKFTDKGTVTLRARWSSPRARFEIEDTGAGIAEEEVSRLFAAFSQTESGRATGEGTGLGLLISRNIARMMGGELRLLSTGKGRGTVFEFEAELPAVESVVAEPRRPVVGLVPGQKSYRILVVDDTQENRLLLVKLLGTVGFEMFEAANGLEAVSAWEACRPDLIWMDMRMPIMDGQEATRRIRAEEMMNDECGMMNEDNQARKGSEIHHSSFRIHHSTKIVALTASAFEHQRDAFLASGADDMIVKPFREETIFEKLTEQLGVRFVHGEIDAVPSPAAPAHSITPERMRAIPVELVEALRLALLTGDPHAARAIARRVEEIDGALAAEIVEGVRAYRFDELLAMIEPIEADAP
jgi:signal transduction histidine kinase/ligand-binding sensor domain-containing protein/CheY-like chemotaxis protein